MVVQRYSTTECLGCIVNAASKSNGAASDSTGSTGNNNNNDSNNMETAMLCPSCVSVSLQSVRERHQLAKETWYESRTKCAEYFQLQQQQDHVVSGQSITAATTSTTVTNESTIRIYEQRYQQLRKELEALQQDCSKVTMETCALNVRIIEQQESISTWKDQYAAQRRQILSQFQQSLCGNNTCQNNNCTTNSNNELNDDTATEKSYATDIINVRQNHLGAFIQNIEITQATVRTLRFHWSLQAFAMFRIQIDEEDMFRSIKSKEKGGDGTTSTETKEEKRNYRVDGTRRLRTGSSSRDSNKVVVSGIGKICGLPLPHAGMELYGVLPCEELQSALRLVAHLTHVIARCFNIRLPHPIVIVPPPPPPQQQQRQPPSSSLISEPMNQQRYASSPLLNYQDGDIADLAYHSKHIPTKHLDGTYDGYTPTAAGIHSITASLTSLSSILGGGGIIESRSATSAPTSSRFQHQNQDLLLSMDPKHVEERIRHATSAIIAEDQSRSTFYTLSTITPTTDTTNDDILQQNATVVNNNNIKKSSNVTDTGSTSQPQQKVNDEFAIALQLLQNDILMICMNVGVPIDELYPGEALLLNLYAIQIYCSDNV